MLLLQIVRACSFSQLIQYDPLTPIFSETHGAWSCVHFILSGECVILQVLKMQVQQTHTHTHLTIYMVKIYWLYSSGYEEGWQSYVQISPCRWEAISTYQGKRKINWKWFPIREGWEGFIAGWYISSWRPIVVFSPFRWRGEYEENESGRVELLWLFTKYISSIYISF